MLQVKEHLTTVLEELEWENLNVAQWKHLSVEETWNSSKKSMHIINTNIY